MQFAGQREIEIRFTELLVSIVSLMYYVWCWRCAPKRITVPTVVSRCDFRICFYFFHVSVVSVGLVNLGGSRLSSEVRFCAWLYYSALSVCSDTDMQQAFNHDGEVGCKVQLERRAAARRSLVACCQAETSSHYHKVPSSAAKRSNSKSK